jgi:hypothetical protein
MDTKARRRISILSRGFRFVYRFLAFLLLIHSSSSLVT